MIDNSAFNLVDTKLNNQKKKCIRAKYKIRKNVNPNVSFIRFLGTTGKILMCKGQDWQLMNHCRH